MSSPNSRPGSIPTPLPSVADVARRIPHHHSTLRRSHHETIGVQGDRSCATREVCALALGSRIAPFLCNVHTTGRLEHSRTKCTTPRSAVRFVRKRVATRIVGAPAMRIVVCLVGAWLFAGATTYSSRTSHITWLPLRPAFPVPAQLSLIAVSLARHAHEFGDGCPDIWLLDPIDMVSAKCSGLVAMTRAAPVHPPQPMV